MNKFLGKEGLTSTSANHLANIAKEMYESLEAKMESLRLVSRDYTLAVNGETYRVENESAKEELSALSASLKEVAALKSLIAWLREGIKAKENECSTEAESEWLKTQIKEGRKELEEPAPLKTISFNDILSEEPVERQARYYSLEAKCATLGKFIHPDGYFASARKTFFEKMRNPTSVKSVGRDAEINKYSSSFSASEVDEEFFALQQEYRSVQADFNSLKSELENKLHEARTSAFRKLRDERKAWQIARDAALLERSAEVKSLKIIIPEPLKGIYAQVADIAKGRN